MYYNRVMMRFRSIFAIYGLFGVLSLSWMLATTAWNVLVVVVAISSKEESVKGFMLPFQDAPAVMMFLSVCLAWRPARRRLKAFATVIYYHLVRLKRTMVVIQL